MAVSGKTIRVGIDLGGTKIEGLALGAADEELARLRLPAPRDDYGATIDAVVGLVQKLEQMAGAPTHVGLGMPGSISPLSGTVQNANSTWLNGRPFARDLELALDRPLRTANDANCFALSEAMDGAAAGFGIVFGVILGTGCGGGIVVNGRIVDGPRGIGGEWGHNPLPSPCPDESPGPKCWCGQRGCLETWVSGPGLAADHELRTGNRLAPEAIAAAANAGDPTASVTLDRHADRLARGLAAVVNLLDPDVIVLGGGLSQLTHLYDALPDLIAPHIFAEDRRVTVRPPRWGATSGVRGAAWLWPAE